MTILATNSDVRYFLFKKLINQFNSKHIILEKVLFKNLDEFENALNLLKITLKKFGLIYQEESIHSCNIFIQN